MCEREQRYAADFLRWSMGVVVGVEGDVLVGYNRLCRVICGVDLERFLSAWAAMCFLFVSCGCASGPGYDIALLDSLRLAMQIRWGGQ